MGLLGRAAKLVVSRHPVASALVVLAACVPVLWWITPAAAPVPTVADADADDLDLSGPLPPRAILNRTWFDKYPEKSRDTVSMWYWMGGGYALFERGSSFRMSLEIFEFERQNDKVVVTALQDKKKTTTGFKIEACDDVEPFNVCLVLDESPRGPKKYYGFARRYDQERHAPSGTAFRKAAEARAASLPRE